MPFQLTGTGCLGVLWDNRSPEETPRASEGLDAHTGPGSPAAKRPRVLGCPGATPRVVGAFRPSDSRVNPLKIPAAEEKPPCPVAPERRLSYCWPPRAIGLGGPRAPMNHKKNKKKILLTSVFGPYGVDDEFGRKESVMELFHNQVTKAQGLASLRFHHRSFGLYFLAENLQAPVAVLDYPTRQRFIAELRRQPYDAVGISSIMPNLAKAREMARLVRELQPEAEILLGGHVTAVENIRQLVDCDHVVRGEGLRWLRRYLGEDEDAPIRHPVIPSAEHKRIFGVPSPGVCGLLIPGVGCVNGCRFCATSHFFDGEYTPYFPTGEALYQEACRLGDALGTNEFFVMDENFLKDTRRAQELLSCMERDDRMFQFLVFSSAEAIQAFGVENLARLGIEFLWLGAESKHETYAKNAGRDLGALVRQLRDYGINVLVSGILFLEHHTPQNIWEDIQYLIDLEGVYTQFMMFTPIPQTKLYREYKARGLIDFDLPYDEWHGQHVLNFHHPHFSPADSTRIINQAFQAEFDQLSSSLHRMLDTAVRGYLTLSQAKDPWLRRRGQQMREIAEHIRLLTPTMHRFAHNALERERVEAVERTCTELFGAPTAKVRATQLFARLLAEAHALRTRYFDRVTQPRTRFERFRWPHGLELPGALRNPARLPLLPPRAELES